MGQSYRFKIRFSYQVKGILQSFLVEECLVIFNKEKRKKMKNKKSLLIIIGACLVIGIIFAVTNMLPASRAKVVLVGIAATLLIIWMVFKMFQMSKLSKIVSGPTHLLYEEKDPAQYVTEMQQILANISGKQQKDLVRINIAAGQVYAGECDEAIQTIEKISIPGQPEVNRVLCYAYAVTAHFFLGQYADVKKIMDEQRKLLKKYDSTTSGLTNNILMLYVFEDITKKEYTHALETLDTLKNHKISTVLQDLVDFSYLKCYCKLKQEEKYRCLLEEMKNRAVVPIIKMQIEK